mmetsp:Transcript_122043/g.345918  ORF Transcript_122043/g.345918 Transcript_122043/m.345918 type:complete len:206 (+) Transcript_122043:781-1398(+)
MYKGGAGQVPGDVEPRRVAAAPRGGGGGEAGGEGHLRHGHAEEGQEGREEGGGPGAAAPGARRAREEEAAGAARGGDLGEVRREDQGPDPGHPEQVQGARRDRPALLGAPRAVLDRHRVGLQVRLRLRRADRVRAARAGDRQGRGGLGRGVPRLGEQRVGAGPLPGGHLRVHGPGAEQRRLGRVERRHRRDAGRPEVGEAAAPRG